MTTRRAFIGKATGTAALFNILPRALVAGRGAASARLRLPRLAGW